MSQLILPETQKFYELQTQEAAAKVFSTMLFVPDKDGNIGTVSDVTAVMRIQYNDGSSTRIHTSPEFNGFLGDFLKANADEIGARVMQKAHEQVKDQQAKAAAEVNSQLDLSTPDPNTGAGIIPAPIITSPLLAVAHTDEPFTYYITAAHSTVDPSAPTTFDAKNLPTGLSLDPVTGKITGTVRKAGVYPVTLIAKNVAGKDQKVLQITIANVSQPSIPPSNKPTIFGPLTAKGKVGESFTYSPQATLLPAEGVKWEATNLPNGLSIAEATGVISGTPAVGADTSSPYTCELKVTTPAGSDTETLTITIESA